jgi:hypothetical protein
MIVVVRPGNGCSPAAARRRGVPGELPEGSPREAEDAKAVRVAFE